MISKMEYITNVTNYLKVIPQSSFKQYFQKWEEQWGRCLAVQGDHSEGDIFNKL
jgi:uncharacterized membrane protein